MKRVLCGALLCLVLPGLLLAQGKVFVLDSDAVHGFNRATTGLLTYFGKFPTGGYSTSDYGPMGGFGIQGALRITVDKKFLLVANGQSDTITVFRIGLSSLQRTALVPARGDVPWALAVYGTLVYVMTAGRDEGVLPQIVAFRLNPTTGTLTYISGSIRVLPANTNSNVEIDRTGQYLVCGWGLYGIALFKLNPTTGLTSTAPLSTRTIYPQVQRPTNFGFSSGNCLIVTSQNRYFSTYRIDTTYKRFVPANYKLGAYRFHASLYNNVFVPDGQKISTFKISSTGYLSFYKSFVLPSSEPQYYAAELALAWNGETLYADMGGQIVVFHNTYGTLSRIQTLYVSCNFSVNGFVAQ